MALFIDSSKINTLGSTLLKRYRRATCRYGRYTAVVCAGLYAPPNI